MKRVPSIHITQEDLVKLIKTLGPIQLNNVKEFMLEARKLAITTRSIAPATKKEKEVLNKVIQSNSGDALLVADLIYSVRIKMKNIGVRKINMNDSQWLYIKELVPVLNEYAVANGLGKREAYINYITAGLELMKEAKKVNYNFAPSWLIQRSDMIIEALNGKDIVKGDDSPESTIQVHDLYVTKVAELTGLYKFFVKDPKAMQHFVKAKETARNYGVSFEDYIEAQFSALEFCNGIPRIQDLYGDKAIERLVRYASKNGIVTSNYSPRAENKPTVDWSKIKN